MPYVEDGFVSPGYFNEPLVTRTINNVDEGVSGISADITSDWSISFTMVDQHGRPTEATDGTSGQEITGYRVRGTIDPTNGEFSLPLWPTDRAVSPVYYRVRIMRKGLDMVGSYIRPLASGDLSDMLLSAFKAQSRW